MHTYPYSILNLNVIYYVNLNIIDQEVLSLQ